MHFSYKIHEEIKNYPSQYPFLSPLWEIEPVKVIEKSEARFSLSGVVSSLTHRCEKPISRSIDLFAIENHDEG